jgi:hypothetical protein
VVIGFEEGGGSKNSPFGAESFWIEISSLVTKEGDKRKR